MIVAVWGIVNEERVDFHPLRGRPSYWEGYAKSAHGLQDIQIWAKTDSGSIGYLDCTVLIKWTGETTARLLLAPYKVKMIREGDCYG